jgi:hypothetical protein
MGASAYVLCPSARHVGLRIVVRNGFNADMADILLSHLERAVADDLSKLATPPPISRPEAFHH